MCMCSLVFIYLRTIFRGCDSQASRKWAKSDRHGSHSTCVIIVWMKQLKSYLRSVRWPEKLSPGVLLCNRNLVLTDNTIPVFLWWGIPREKKSWGVDPVGYQSKWWASWSCKGQYNVMLKALHENRFGVITYVPSSGIWNTLVVEYGPKPITVSAATV